MTVARKGLSRDRSVAWGTPENVRQMLQDLEAAWEPVARRLALFVLGNTPPSKDVRQILLHEAPMDRRAFVIASAPVRMAAKVVMRLSAQADQTRFFATEADGLAWLTLASGPPGHEERRPARDSEHA